LVVYDLKFNKTIDKNLINKSNRELMTWKIPIITVWAL